MIDYTNGQVMGKVVLFFGEVLGGLAGMDPRAALCRWGVDVEAIYPHQWYPAHRLHAMLDSVEQVFPAITLPEIGAQIAQQVDWQRVTDLRDAFIRVNVLYHQTHRSLRGGYFYPSAGSQRRHLRIYARTIYPQSLEYGLCWGIARRFAPAAEAVTVLQLGCKEADGLGHTVYHISLRTGMRGEAWSPPALPAGAQLNRRHAGDRQMWLAAEAAS